MRQSLIRLVSIWRVTGCCVGWHRGDVKPGAQYADAIVRAITDAKALVLVLSGSAIGSSHVGREIERAASKHKQIIALKIDTAPLTPALEYFLSES